MKKYLIAGILMMLCTLSLTAGPAYPGRIVYTQPDGSTIGLRLHGDEYGHWMTNDAGQIMKQDADGFWRVSDVQDAGAIEQLQEKASARREEASRVRREYAQKASQANFGSPKIPVILVGFRDWAFSKTAAEFEALLMQEGYSANNAIGSVYDYFNENSFGAFRPQFEVLGPVTLDNNMAHYGGNDNSDDDKLPEMALVHAAQKLDGTVDFSRYDNDGDGTVDFVMFYYAGYDEAQYGPSDAIWSHAWYLSSSSNARNSRTFDNVKLDRYFCTAELKGNSGSTMCSIGTTCHEFAHTLGLPDFYDTNYETNGEAANMYDFDLMASGSYNVNSTTPPYLNAEELNEIGWLPSIPDMPTSGSVTLLAVNDLGAGSYHALKANTSVTNEYFVFETRGGRRWDAGIPAGLLVYHVDKSSNRVSGTTTASSLWNSNKVNAYSAHPCCYVVPASNPTSTTLYNGVLEKVIFPGNDGVRVYNPTAWNGNAIGIQLKDITYANQVVTFNVVDSDTNGVTGLVMNADGVPVAGATILASVESSASAAPKRAPRKGDSLLDWASMLFRPSEKRMDSIRKAAATSTVTDAEGNYFLELEAGTYLLTVSAEGYLNQSQTVTVTNHIETVNFYLLGENEDVPSVLVAWPSGVTETYTGSTVNNLTAQNQYPSDQLRRYYGKQIKAITFFTYNYQNEAVYEDVNVIIDYEGDRMATVPVSAETLRPGGYTTVDLRSQELIIPSNKDIYAGFGFSRGGYLYNNYYYAFGAFQKTNDWDADGTWPYEGWVSYFNKTRTGARSDWNMIFDITLTIGDYEGPDVGYNYIADPGNGVYAAGDEFPLTLVETEGVRRPGSTIAWYLDDEPVSGESVTLSAGSHVIEARFTTTEGNTKVVELTVTAE